MHVTLEAVPFREAMKTFAVVFDGEIDVLATADDDVGGIVLEAGRNGIYVKFFLEAKVHTEGCVALDCLHFTHLRFAKGSTLDLNSDGKQISFKSGNLRGKISCKPSIDDIEGQRPLEEFKAKITLPASVFKNSIDRATFTSALPNTVNGVRLQAGDMLKVSTTDHFRASLYKEDLAIPQKEIDILLKASFIQTILSRSRDDIEVSIGAQGGIFKFATDTMEIYHPTIQSEPEDIEEWIENGVDYSAKKCTITTTVEDLTGVIDEASSIAVGALGFDTHIEILVKGTKLLVRVRTDHADAQSSLLLTESNATKHLTKLSSRYLLEMLRLVKSGEMEVGMWTDFIMLKSNGGKFTALIPTIAI